MESNKDFFVAQMESRITSILWNHLSNKNFGNGTIPWSPLHLVLDTPIN